MAEGVEQGRVLGRDSEGSADLGFRLCGPVETREKCAEMAADRRILRFQIGRTAGRLDRLGQPVLVGQYMAQGAE